MSKLIKVKESTKSELKKFAIRRFGEDAGKDITYDTIISILLKDAETKGFDFNKLLKLIEKGVK